jgi:hypothetical protein
VGIVRSTSDLEVVSDSPTPGGEWDDVMELQETAFGAAAVRPDERAPAIVTAPDLPLDRRWNVV